MTAGVTRLKHRADFLRIAASGRKKVTPGFVLQANQTPGDVIAHQESAAMRVGYTVTRKIGKAVVRNRATRRLRTAALDALGTHGQLGFDYVLIGRRSTSQRPYAKLVSELRAALADIHASSRASQGAQ